MTTENQEPFALVKERCTLYNLNIRSEKFGEEDVPAVDVGFSMTTSNSILKKIDARLLKLLYEHGKQTDIEDEFMRQLRFPLLDTLGWSADLHDIRLEVHDVAAEKNNVVMCGGKIKKFKIDAKDGGSVTLGFQVQISKADMALVGALGLVLKHDVPVTLHVLAPAEQPDNFAQADLLGQEPMSEAREKAESLFDKPPSDLAIDQAAVAMQDQAGDAGVIPDPENIDVGDQVLDKPVKAPPKKRGGSKAAAEPIE